MRAASATARTRWPAARTRSATGADKLAGGAGKLAGGLQKGADQIPSGGDPKQQSKVIADPVDSASSTLNPSLDGQTLLTPACSPSLCGSARS